MQSWKMWGVIGAMAIAITSGCGDNADPGDPPPPKPEFTVAPAATNVQVSFADITWETNTPTTGEVRYGTSSNDYSFDSKREQESTVHSVRLFGLKSNTTYYYQVESKNSSGTLTSEELNFSTTRTLAELVPYAWSLYESGQTSDAIAIFMDITTRQTSAFLSDAYNGLGWSYASQDSMQKSLHYFDLAISARASFSEALAGRGLVRLALKEYAGTIDDLTKVLSEQVDFVFSHDSSIDFRDISVALAEAYFFRQNLEQAQTFVNHIAPENGLDVNNSNTWIVDDVQYNDYTTALLMWIEKLKSMV
jgi:tetratricopeptide (TPR) repeat protein